MKKEYKALAAIIILSVFILLLISCKENAATTVADTEDIKNTDVVQTAPEYSTAPYITPVPSDVPDSDKQINTEKPVETEAETNTPEDSETPHETTTPVKTAITPQTPKTTAPNETTAPETEIPNIKLADGVTMDMTDASFWLGDGADDIIMTRSEIREYNLKNINENKYIGVRDIKNFPNTYSAAKMLLAMLEFGVPGEDQFINGKPITKEYISELVKYCNKEAATGNLTVRWGIITNRTNTRCFPSEDFCARNQYERNIDSFQQSELLLGDAVAVLHSTKDGKWHFFVCDRFFGWVKNEDVAFCKNKEEWQGWQREDNILVVTGKRITAEQSVTVKGLENLVLTMGTRLLLAHEKDLKNDGRDRSAYGCYTVKIPQKGSDGTLRTVLVDIPMSEDVSQGYLDYTRANLLGLVFKMEGSVYGWGGMFSSCDCSGLVGQVYRCFGILSARNSSAIIGMNGKRTDVSGMTVDEKKLILDKLEVGSLLYFPGHIMFYLGKSNGNYYVISALSIVSFTEKDEPVVISFPRSVMINTLDVRRKSGKSWIESLTNALMITK